MIELEKKNFRINSEGWKILTNSQGITYRENSEKDIWEYVDGVDEGLIGQQLFTWDAAMRETKKAGKRMPSDEEWGTLVDDGRLKKEAMQFNSRALPAGFRYTDGSFVNLSGYTYIWSSLESGGNAWRRNLLFSHTVVLRDTVYKLYGFSVRCLKD